MELRERAVLVVIDVQERLAPRIEGIDDVLKSCVKLIKACRIMGIPIIATEQVKLGDTVGEIRSVLNSEPIRKVSFSCCGSEEFVKALKSTGRDLCVLCGIEAHICVLQTALDLLKMGYDVMVAVDCIGSRRRIDKEVAVMRMVSEGVRVTTAEMFIYEAMRSADVDFFREVLQIIKEG